MRKLITPHGTCMLAICLVFLAQSLVAQCIIDITALNKTDETCLGASDGTLVVAATGAGSIEYQLNAGAFGPGNTFNGLAPGNYTVTVRDAANPNCTNAETITILPGAQPQPLITGERFACAGSTHTYTTPAHVGSTWTWALSGGGNVVVTNQNSITVHWTGAQASTWTLSVTETDAQGCSKTVALRIAIRETVLVCNDMVQVSVADQCRAKIYPDMILEGTYLTYEGLQVHLTPLSGNATVMGDTVVGRGIVKVTVTEPCSQNSCWGRIMVEDKTPPTINCGLSSVVCSFSDTSVAMPNLSNTPTFAIAYSGLGNVVVNDNCAIARIWYVDEYVDVNCTDLFGVVSAKIIRRWSAEDVSGNVGTCAQEIRFLRVMTSDVIFPADIEIACTNANTHPSNTGVPRAGAYPLWPTSFFCEINATYSDLVIPICSGAYKIVRTWIVADWCKPFNAPGNPNYNPNLPDNPRSDIQIIKVIDNAGPTFSCPQDVTASTDALDCGATVNLPDVIVSDACSHVVHARAITPLGDVVGQLTDFPGNNWWQPDTMVAFGQITGLPIGKHTIIYEISDDCGNHSTCSFVLEVLDDTPPLAVCDQDTRVSLGADGTIDAAATIFNDGSYDNCGQVYFKVRRMDGDPCNAQTDAFFRDKARFCCEDVAQQGPIVIVLRVYDRQPEPGAVDEDYLQGHYDDCMVNVRVDDKLKPFCYAPNAVTVNCEAFDPSLWAYGQPSVFDNCELDTVTVSFNYTEFDTMCNRGTIRRTFTAWDVAGNSSRCTQQISVIYQTNFRVKFPDDVLVTNCNNGTGNYGEPIFYGEDCELTAISYTDQIFTLVPDACYKIIRTWKVIDWCNFDPNTAPTILPNPQNSDFGPTAYATQGNRGYFQYAQVIKVVDNQKPVISDCPTAPVIIEDLTPNDPLLWNNMSYWDNVHQTHDLCEGPAPLSITATDDCSGSKVEISFQIKVDWNLDGTFDLTYNSGQAGSPALDISINGDFKTGSISPNFQFPYGKHKITWYVRDGCGNVETCHYIFQVKDGKAPTVTCFNGLAVNLMPTGMITLWAIDFVNYAQDNCTPSDQLKYAIRKVGTGAGFPVDANGLPLVSVTYDCNELGTQIVEVWAQDKAGNASYCETYLLVQDPDGYCNPNQSANVAGLLQTEEIEGVQQAFVKIAGANNALPTPGMFTDADGGYNFNALPAGDDYTITPEKNVAWLNGVSTFDLLLITKHILNVQPLDSPYKIIAADANRSGSVTSFDVVQLRKMILGMADNIPGNQSWRFVRKNHVFANPQNPFQAPLPESIVYQDLHAGAAGAGDFVGIKVGDVNNNAQPNNFAAADDRTPPQGILHFDLENRYVKHGEIVDVRLHSEELAQVLGYQFSLAFAPGAFELLELQAGNLPDLSSENFGTSHLSEGILTASWHSAEVVSGPHDILTIRLRAKQDGLLNHLLHLSNRVTTTEAYNHAGERYDVKLRFRDANGSTVQGAGFELLQNRPNPFSDRTLIGFYLPEAAPATLTVFDAAGRTVQTVKGDYAKGYNAISLEKSSIYEPGVYYYRLETNTESDQKVMVIHNR